MEWIEIEPNAGDGQPIQLYPDGSCTIEGCPFPITQEMQLNNNSIGGVRVDKASGEGQPLIIGTTPPMVFKYEAGKWFQQSTSTEERASTRDYVPQQPYSTYGATKPSKKVSRKLAGVLTISAVGIMAGITVLVGLAVYLTDANKDESKSKSTVVANLNTNIKAPTGKMPSSARIRNSNFANSNMATNTDVEQPEQLHAIIPDSPPTTLAPENSNYAANSNIAPQTNPTNQSNNAQERQSIPSFGLWRARIPEEQMQQGMEGLYLHLRSDDTAVVLNKSLDGNYSQLTGLLIWDRRTGILKANRSGEFVDAFSIESINRTTLMMTVLAEESGNKGVRVLFVYQGSE